MVRLKPTARHEKLTFREKHQEFCWKFDSFWWFIIKRFTLQNRRWHFQPKRTLEYIVINKADNEIMQKFDFIPTRDDLVAFGYRPGSYIIKRAFPYVTVRTARITWGDIEVINQSSDGTVLNYDEDGRYVRK